MNLGGDVGHSVWKLGKVGTEGAVGIPAVRPAVVQDYVVVSGVTEAEFDHAVCGAQEEIFGDGAAEGVPVVLACVKKIYGKCKEEYLPNPSGA